MTSKKMVSSTSTYVPAGGRGSRLLPLTSHRSKPAVPFGDRRIIDFTLSNCLRSDLVHPHVITQYQGAHLTQHVRRWWLEQSACAADASASPVCVPAPKSSYAGTTDALFRNLQSLNSDTEHVLVLSADHIYDMDYQELLQSHLDSGADATLASIVYPSEWSQQFGIIDVDRRNRIVGFEEKPPQPREIPGMPGKVLANMGIYVFRKDVLVAALRTDAADPMSSRDIGRSLIPYLVTHKKVFAFRFNGYWKDVGTIDSYYEANMEWLPTLPATHRLAGSGSVIAQGVRIHPTAQVMESILMPGVVIGENARIRRAILDENVHVFPYTYVGFSDSEKRITVVPANTVVTRETQTHADRQPAFASLTL